MTVLQDHFTDEVFHRRHRSEGVQCAGGDRDIDRLFRVAVKPETFAGSNAFGIGEGNVVQVALPLCITIFPEFHPRKQVTVYNGNIGQRDEIPPFLQVQPVSAFQICRCLGLGEGEGPCLVTFDPECLERFKAL